MDNETEVVDSPEASAPISADLPSIEESPIEEREGAASETTEAPAPKSWTYDEWKDHEGFKEWYEEESREHQIRGQEREFGRTQKIQDQIKQEFLDKADYLTTSLTEFSQSLHEALQNDPDGVTKALRNPQVFKAYKEAAELSKALQAMPQSMDNGPVMQRTIVESFVTAMGIAAHVAGNPDMIQPFVERFIREQRFDEERRGGVALEKFFKEVLKAADDKGYKRGLADGRKGTVEAAKAESRNGQGPSATEGSAGGGRPTPAQYAAATSEQRKEWREKGIEPLAR